MTNPDFLFGLTPGDVVYDIETYPNVFTIGLLHRTTKQRWFFEISFRRNDIQMLCRFIEELKAQNCRLVGFNNIGFDYPVIHFIYQNRHTGITVADIYNKAMSIINAPHQARFSHMVWESDWLVPQIDLYKIHHFDNPSKATGLKVLEFNMRMSNIEDLPFPVGIELSSEQADTLVDYMWHDIDATDKFADETTDQIRFREELSVKYDRSFLNHNDTKIGKDFFIMKLEEAQPGSCYQYTDGKRRMVQTQRDSIDLSEVVLPHVQFEHPEFQRILAWFKSQVITETKGVFKDANCVVNGFQFDFGTGGIHGATSPGVFFSDENFVIESRDVKSYYPNLAISNRFYPAHLGGLFCDIYKEVYEQRAATEKGSSENAMLKLALNGVYGDSNNQYSPFYDPQYTMSITINGQLLLCMLAEQLMKVPGLQMLLINTDGLEYRAPRQYAEHIESVCTWWEQLTQLELESDIYKRLCIRDCNNYIGVFEE